MIVDVLPKEQTHSKEGRAIGVKDRLLKVGKAKVALGSIAPCTGGWAMSSFTVNPPRRQQENITVIKDNDCNCDTDIIRATQIAHA